MSSATWLNKMHLVCVPCQQRNFSIRLCTKVPLRKWWDAALYARDWRGALPPVHPVITKETSVLAVGPPMAHELTPVPLSCGPGDLRKQFQLALDKRGFVEVQVSGREVSAPHWNKNTKNLNALKSGKRNSSTLPASALFQSGTAHGQKGSSKHMTSLITGERKSIQLSLQLPQLCGMLPEGSISLLVSAMIFWI